MVDNFERKNSYISGAKIAVNDIQNDIQGVI